MLDIRQRHFLASIGCLLSFAGPIAAQWRTAYFMDNNSAGQTAQTIPWSKYTHVVHYALRPASTDGTCGWDATGVNFTESRIAAFVDSAHAAGVKAVLGISEDQTLTAIQSCTAPANIQQFVGLISGFVKSHGYDGVDIEWGRGVLNTPYELQYQDLIRTLRSALPAATLTVPVSVANSPMISAVADGLDQINIMAYGLDIFDPTGEAKDASGPFMPFDRSGGNGVDRTLQARLAAAGIAASKVGIGIPFYGVVHRGCRSASEDARGSAGATQPDQSSLNAITRSLIPYQELIGSRYWTSATHVWDSLEQTQYLSYSGGTCETDALVPYGGPEQIRAAMGDVTASKFGGVMTYGLPYEYRAGETGDARYPLSSVLHPAISPGGAVVGQAKVSKTQVAAPSITTPSALPAALVASPYSQTLAASGGTPITWAMTGGALPGGLSLNSSTGVLSGTPTAAGMFAFTVQASNSAGSSSLQLSLAVTAPVVGINFSEAECWWGSFASLTDLLYVHGYNLNLIRLPIAWERAQPTIGGPLASGYISALKTFIQAANAQGIQVIVDVHNYGRYNPQWAQQATTGVYFCTEGDGNVIGSAALPISAFADLWTKLATALAGTPGLAYYDIMNEPHDMGSASVWPSAAQAAVNAIRSVDTSTQILVEGTAWASALNWINANASLHVTDPANKLLYEAHQYFDADGSSLYVQSYEQQGAYPTIGVDRLQPFLTWLQQNGARGFIGEFGIPNNDPLWLPVLDNFLTALQSAGIPGTYWRYAFHSPTDPSWWPGAADSISIVIGRSNPQLNVLSAHASGN